jgi:hypothetical protein
MTVTARTLTTVAWGLFFIVIGGAWFYTQITGMDVWTVVAIGVGLVLIGLNIAREEIGARIGRLSLGVGILALLIGFARYEGVRVDVVPLIIILIGLFIIAEAIVRR